MEVLRPQKVRAEARFSNKLHARLFAFGCDGVFVWLYNHHLPQKALGHEAPVQALKAWKMKAHDLFVKNVRNHQGPDA